VQQGAEVGALDEAHVDEELAVDFAEVVDRHDVGFLEASGGMGLPLHTSPKYVVRVVFLGDGFGCDGAVFDGVVGFVDFAHSAAAQQSA
jgi:hypothetical protein